MTELNFKSRPYIIKKINNMGIETEDYLFYIENRIKDEPRFRSFHDEIKYDKLNMPKPLFDLFYGGMPRNINELYDRLYGSVD